RSGNTTAHAERSSAGAAAVTGAVSGTFAGTDAASATGANAAAVARSIRSHGRQVRHGIAEVGHVRLLQFNLGGNQNRWVNFEFRIRVAHHGRGRSERLHGLFGQTALRGLQFVAIATTAAAAALSL